MVSAMGTEVMGENELGRFTSQIGRAPSQQNQIISVPPASGCDPAPFQASAKSS
jgi:hypothetical protein